MSLHSSNGASGDVGARRATREHKEASRSFNYHDLSQQRHLGQSAMSSIMRIGIRALGDSTMDIELAYWWGCYRTTCACWP